MSLSMSGLTAVPMRARRRTCLWIAGAALLTAAQLTAGTYYVATNGSDGNPGTSSQPFRTVQTGVNAAVAGDTIIVQNGFYAPPSSAGCSGGSGYAVAINKAGTSSAPITLRAATKWGATLDATNCHSSIYLYSGAAYWIIQDFVIANGSWGGISSNSGAGYITIKGNEIRGVGQRYETSAYGIFGVYTNADSHDFVFDGNVIHDIGRTGGANLFNDHGLYVHSRNTTIVNNIFYRPISGWPIQTASGFGGVIENNTFHGPHPTREGQIMLWDPNYSVTVRNNIFYNPRSQAVTSYAFSLYSGSSCAVQDNIVYGSGVALGAPSNCSASNNRLNTDPLLVNAASAPYDFHLTANSPAIDTGATLSTIRTDVFGNARPQGNGYDVGAAEYAAAVPLSISGVAATNVGANSATITWTTSAPADSRVDYGASVIAQSTPVDSQLVTSHSVVLTGLSASTRYIYHVVSKDSSGRVATSPDYTFTTASAPAPFGFALSASPASVTLQPGSSAGVTVTATLVSGTPQGVSFSASVPPGVTASFSPSSCIVSCSATLTLSASSSAVGGTVTASAAGGGASAYASVAVSIAQPATTPDPDLEARWTFGEGSGTIAHDSTPNRNDGILRGTTTWYSANGISAILFRNPGDHVEVNAGPSLSLSSAMTVSFWIMAQDVPNVDERIISKSYSWDIKLNGASRIIQFTSGGKYAQLDYVLPTGTWKHVVITFSSGYIAGYIDGRRVSLVRNTFSRRATLPDYNYGLVIGTDAARTSSMKGMLDDVRIYSRVLSASEVAALYTAAR